MVGIVFGAAVGGSVLYFVPLIDQERENSIINISPNGGISEVFHANIPTDRIMIGAPGQQTSLPAGLDWPSDALLADTRAELFKIRNAKDAVVGVASRISARDQDGELIEWVLHLPARGSVYFLMHSEATTGGYRSGELRAGTREFSGLTGYVTEHWIADTTGIEDAPAGRIELRSGLSAIAEAQL